MAASMTTTQPPPPPVGESWPSAPQQQQQPFELNLQHGHKDLVQAIAFNTYGDRCATGSVDGKIRVFNRHKDGTWRICDTWTAHGAEVLELQWLPSTVYPNVLASLGLEGWFRLWAEDPSAAPGRRFCAGRTSSGRPIFDTRSSRSGSAYRSFSMSHNDETKHTYLALLTTEGRLAVWETEQPEALHEYTSLDEFLVLPQRPPRGEETAFTCVFDPNPEPCYAALRAGVPTDALGLAVAAMDVVRVYRSRDTVAASYGMDTAKKEFYLAVEVSGHRGLVRDIAWAPGNIRGYDMIATACQDGYARVFRIDTPVDSPDRQSWAMSALITPERSLQQQRAAAKAAAAASLGTSSPSKDSDGTQTPPPLPPPHSHNHHPSTLSASLASKAAAGSTSSGAADPRLRTGQPGQPGTVAHTAREISRLDNHRTPVWRVGFDDDGQILGTTGDDGKLLCYRQTPDGAWARSSEMVMMKTRMAAP
ncbi:nucleoporin seh1 [Cordyceps militaris CM01]|uniref:Nucleoporin seh1 n=1 Tax=Cordyceps militaris (strain CM01) TaxID=983644 RepID=G3JA97_CORMM|nr:nucleoporin seh1 [Cordyceps militaris CM01]EGX94267.1 nucleoporin seh1 [Cordyceps militaris CM01]